MQNKLNHCAEVFNQAALAKAKEINKSIPDSALPFEFVNTVEIYCFETARENALDCCSMLIDEAIDEIEKTQASMRLPKGYMGIGFRDVMGDGTVLKNKTWYVCLNLDELPDSKMGQDA